MPEARKPPRAAALRRGALGTMLQRGAALILITLTQLFLPAALAQEQREYEVKAAFLYNFTKFVEWPPDPRPDRGPIRICVIGEDPFRESLDKIVAGKLVDGRSLTVRRIERAADARTCAIAFVSTSERTRLRSILETLRGANVLTVGDTRQFAEMGGVIGFVLRDNLVHFAVNLDAAKIQGLTISSRLLNLAEIVRSKPPGGSD